MWILVTVHWAARVHVSIANFEGGPLEFVNSLALCFFQGPACALLMASAFALYGVQFFQQFSFDRSLIGSIQAGCREPKNDYAN